MSLHVEQQKAKGDDDASPYVKQKKKKIVNDNKSSLDGISKVQRAATRLKFNQRKS